MNTEKQLERSEVPENMIWDLSSLYNSIEDWENDFSKIDAKLAEFLKYQGKLAESAETLVCAFRSSDELERLAEKIYTYAHLKSDEDISNSENLAYLDRISAKFAEISGQTAWFDPEILLIDDKQIQEYLNSDDLSFYKRSLEDILRSKKHSLSAKEERLLGLAGEVFASPHKTFGMLNNVDIKFPKIKNEEGNLTELTHGNYIKFLESSNREVRKSAFNAMYDTFGGFKNTLSSTLDGTVKKHSFNAKIRNFSSSLEASLFSDNVPVEVYNNLIQSIHDNFEPLHDYYDLKRKVLKVDKLDMYDVYCPLVPEQKIEVSWEDACKWVFEALRPLGEEYINILESAFKNRWIDVLESKGKRSGAYSGGCYDSMPYVLMNFNGTLNEVFTLAHELGHSMHSFYSNKNQDYHYASYSIFVAEVASTTNELLLHDYLLKNNKDEKFQLHLLNHLADSFRSTVYRQTMFAEFEKLIHEQSENGIPLTPDSLSKSYYDLNAKYHGDAVNPSQKIDMEWSRIPHFYYNFYVYKYATGFSAASALSKNILTGDNKKLDNYLGFLKAGDSKDVLDIMTDAGVNLRTTEPITKGLIEFKNTVNQLKQIL